MWAVTFNPTATHRVYDQPYGYAVMQPATRTKRNRMSPLTSAAGHSLPMITAFLFMYNEAYLSSTMVSTLRN